MTGQYAVLLTSSYSRRMLPPVGGLGAEGRRWRRDCRRRRYFFFSLCPDARAQTLGSRERIAAGGVEARHAPDHQSHRTPRQTARRKAKAAANEVTACRRRRRLYVRRRRCAMWPAVRRLSRRTASQMTVSGQDLNNRAVTRPGEILEAAPGLAVVSHADGGKANQYYLRGYNLDHGTDLADLRRRHADQPADPRPRPGLCRSQLADAGNGRQPRHPQRSVLRRCRRFRQRRLACFSICATASIRKSSKRRQAASITTGFSRWDRPNSAAARCSMPARRIPMTGRGRSPDDMQKFSGLLRYSQGTATDGFSASAMAYSNIWNTTEQNAAARDHDRTDRPLRRDRSDRRRQYQPLIRCRRGWRNRMATAHGRPMPIW